MAAPALWLVHFLAVYVTVIATCGRWPPSVDPHAMVAGLTVAALIALAALWIGAGRPGGLRPLQSGAGAAFDTTLTRRLVAMSGVAMVFVATAAILTGGCR